MASPDADRQRDEERLSELSSQLLQRASAAIGPWVRNSVAFRADPGREQLDNAAVDRAAAAAEASGSRQLATLLEADIDTHTTNPLAILRSLVVYPTEVLLAAGVPPVGRDADAVRLHPDDLYDLTPGAFSDFGPEVHEAGMMWGAGKAHIHLKRRRSEGQR